MGTRKAITETEKESERGCSIPRGIKSQSGVSQCSS
nr:MAG TPA: hypothetical protein [Caudoviricetes sp.]